MDKELPDPAKVWQAIEIYLTLAYDGAAPPGAAQRRVAILRQAESLYDSPAFELDKKDSPSRWSLRLGNKNYPHMKLSIDRQPDGRGYLFRADTHDRHLSAPAGSKDHAMFAELMAKNQQTAQAIESAWAQRGLRTFKTFLREDLARRQGQANKGSQSQ